MKLKLFHLLLGMVGMLGINPNIQAQQFSFSSGNDISSVAYQAHVSVGQLFGSYHMAQPSMQEGVFSVLMNSSQTEEALTLAKSIHIYPNPGTEAIYIESAIFPYVIRHASIYSLQGMEVGSYNIYDSQTPISVSHLAAGSYILRLSLVGKEDAILKMLKIN